MYYKASFPLPPPPRPPPPSRDLGNVRESRADGFGTGQWREGGREGVSGCGPHQRGSGVRSASDGENASEKRGREGIRKQEAPRGLRAGGRTDGWTGGRADGRKNEMAAIRASNSTRPGLLLPAEWELGNIISTSLLELGL